MTWTCSFCKGEHRSPQYVCAKTLQARAAYKKREALLSAQKHGKYCDCSPDSVDRVKCRWCSCSVSDLQHHLTNRCWQYQAQKEQEENPFLTSTIVVVVVLVGGMAISFILYTFGITN